MKLLYCIFILEIGLICWAFGQNDIPDVPAQRTPPSPIVGFDGVYSTGSEPVIYYVMAVEYQTNGVDEVVREIQFINITNSVAAYPKMLTIKIKTKSNLLDEWEDSGQEFLMKLGTNTAEFYTAELRIE